jgi:hypothetical protein
MKLILGIGFLAIAFSIHPALGMISCLAFIGE